MADEINSILESVKKLTDTSDKYYEPDLIMHINTVFSKLQQLGVGPKNGFAIVDDSATWDEYTQNLAVLNMVKSYMAIQVKLLFDISTASSYLIQEYNSKSSELEWRLNAAVDYNKEES